MSTATHKNGVRYWGRTDSTFSKEQHPYSRATHQTVMAREGHAKNFAPTAASIFTGGTTDGVESFQTHLSLGENFD
jgi:hypothetical protein